MSWSIMEKEHVLQSDLSRSLLLMNMQYLLSMAPLYELCRKKEKQSVIFVTWAVLQMFLSIKDSRTCVQQTMKASLITVKAG